MSKHNKYIDCILNPPKNLEKGQIWKNPFTGMEFLITEIIPVDGVVRASLISTAEYFADKGDVALVNTVFGRKRYVLRVTDGPVPTDQLVSYCGKIGKRQLEKVLKSLKDNKYSYDEAQEILIAEILDSLVPLREIALDKASKQ